MVLFLSVQVKESPFPQRRPLLSAPSFRDLLTSLVQTMWVVWAGLRPVGLALQQGPGRTAQLVGVPGWDLFYWSFISGLTKMGPWVAGQTSGPRAERSMTQRHCQMEKKGRQVSH